MVSGWPSVLLQAHPLLTNALRVRVVRDVSLDRVIIAHKSARAESAVEVARLGGGLDDVIGLAQQRCSLRVQCELVAPLMSHLRACAPWSRTGPRGSRSVGSFPVGGVLRDTPRTVGAMWRSRPRL